MDEEEEEDVGPSVADFLPSTLDVLGGGGAAEKEESEGQAQQVQIGGINEVEEAIRDIFDGKKRKKDAPADKKKKEYVYYGVPPENLNNGMRFWRLHCLYLLLDCDCVEEALEKKREEAEFIEEYNRRFRPKTLMEEHQEKVQDRKRKDTRSKKERLTDFMNRPFNRDEDLRRGVDSKKVFKMLYHGPNSLGNRFMPSSN